LGNLSTPKGVQKLQTALHAKAKAEAGYRFYALYDKISREDILAHAYAQCRSNKGAPGVDGQDFADIEAYGVQRWLGELALALRQETYRPDPIRRVFIPKANGKLRPLGISTLRDRVCMTAAMLVLEPIFEADLPPEQYAYRPGRNAQQAVVEVGALLYRGHPEVVDADLADYFGSIPHPELLKSVARRIVDRRVLHLIKIEEGRHARPRPGTNGAAFRKVHRSHHCWRICICAGSCWDGRCSGWREASALVS
jgi:RNA-directed DNA polymerase